MESGRADGQRVVDAGRASMEPWHFSHGELQNDDVDTLGFQASMEPWHFSHGEMSLDLALVTDTDASMEPWHFSHGEAHDVHHFF